VKFEVNAESGDGRYWAVPARAYALRFHGVHRPDGHILVDDKEIPRGDTGKATRSGASWHLDEQTGDVIVSIPRSTKRSFVVKFTTAAAWTCASDC
jgi:hypothetical protein